MRWFIVFVLLFIPVLCLAEDETFTSIPELPRATDKGLEDVVFTIEKMPVGDIRYRTRGLTYSTFTGWITADLQDTLKSYIETQNVHNRKTKKIDASSKPIKDVINDIEITDSLLVRSFYISARNDTIFRSITPKSNMKIQFAADCKLYFDKDTTWSKAFDLFDLTGLHDVVVDLGGANITALIDSSGKWNQWDGGIKVESCERVYIGNGVLSDFAGDGVTVRNSCDIVVENITFSQTHLGDFDGAGNRVNSSTYYLGRNGVAAIADSGKVCENIIFNNINGYNGAPALVDVEPNPYGTIRNITLSNINANYKNTGVAEIDKNIFPYGVSLVSQLGAKIENLTVINCNIVGAKHTGIAIVGNVSGVVSNCTVDSSKVGITVRGAHVKLVDNIVKNSTTTGLTVWNDGDSVEVSNNIILNSGGYGISINGTQSDLNSNIRVTNNYIDNSGDIGLHANNTENCIFTDNVISNSQSFGMYFRNSVSPLILNNILKNNTEQIYYTGCANPKEFGTVVDDSLAIEYIDGKVNINSSTFQVNSASTNIVSADSLSDNLFDSGMGTFETGVEGWFQMFSFYVDVKTADGAFSGDSCLQITDQTPTDEVVGLASQYLNDSGMGVEIGNLTKNPAANQSFKIEFMYKSNNDVTLYLNPGEGGISEYSMKSSDTWTGYSIVFSAESYKPYLYFEVSGSDTLFVDDVKVYELLGGDLFVNNKLFIPNSVRTGYVEMLPIETGTDSVKVGSVYVPTTNQLGLKLSNLRLNNILPGGNVDLGNYSMFAKDFRLQDTYLVNRVLYNIQRDNSVSVYGGPSWEQGAIIALYGDEHASRAGKLEMIYGSNSKTLSDGVYLKIDAKNNGINHPAVRGYLDGKYLIGTGSTEQGAYLRADGNGLSLWEPVLSTWSIVIDSTMISTNSNISFFYTPVQVQIDTLVTVLRNGSSPSVKVDIRFSSSRSSIGTSIITAPAASTSTTSGERFSSFNYDTIPPGSFVWIKFTEVASKPEDVLITLIGRK